MSRSCFAHLHFIGSLVTSPYMLTTHYGNTRFTLFCQFQAAEYTKRICLCTVLILLLQDFPEAIATVVVAVDVVVFVVLFVAINASFKLRGCPKP